MALRTFTAGDGTVWNVWNVVPSISHTHQRLAVGEPMLGGWLCFDSGRVKRRIVPVPEGWEAWSDGELAEALAVASPVAQREYGSASPPREPSDDEQP